ncbi:MAG: hypothetical protein COB02_06490 [Candidatus Cloacimonadota bacterium]|nr:MAG: hypothetical protein COB02_06490 [Candidatus Cloacimonadota bacterium]
MDYVYSKNDYNLEIEIPEVFNLEALDSLRVLLLKLIDKNIKNVKFYCSHLISIDGNGLTFFLSLAKYLRIVFINILLSFEELNENVFKLLMIARLQSFYNLSMAEK